MAHQVPEIPAILERNASSVQSISLRIRGAQSAYRGQIAGQRVQSALAFAFSQPCEGMDAWAPPMEHNLVWQSIPAELEARRVDLEFAHGLYASYFRSDDAEFWIDVDGHHAELMRYEGDPAVWVFGPMLILALARRGIFCLHSSAVQLPVGALLLMGASGAGKSTFARVTTRLCDDISPLALLGKRLMLLPQFPQLKLRQPDSVPESAVVSALFLLQAAVSGQPECISVIGARELHRQLLAHTVASRLFTPLDSQRWWSAIARWCQLLEGRAYELRPAHDANTPDRAMLAALASVRTLL